MNVVILVAGTGSRLMPLTRNTPKSLLDLGDGYTLLERQLQAISAVGLNEVVLVTGYKSEQIEAKIKDYSNFKFRIAYNPFYKMANNMVSAWFGLKDLHGPTILVNGDDLFKPIVLQTLLSSEQSITMVISRKDGYDQDDMKVVTKDDRILDVGKDIDASKANGESIGMMLFRQRGLTEIQQYLNRMVRLEDNLQLFYLAAMRRLMQEGHPVHYVECAPHDWSEVDFHPDLQQMREQIQVSLRSWEQH